MSNEPGQGDFSPKGQQGDEGQVSPGHVRGEEPHARPAGPPLSGSEGPDADTKYTEMAFGLLEGLPEAEREKRLASFPPDVRDQIKTELERRKRAASGAPGEEGADEGTQFGFGPASPEPSSEEVEKEKASLGKVDEYMKEGKIKEAWEEMGKPGAHGEALQFTIDTVKENEDISSEDERSITEKLTQFNTTDQPLSREEAQFVLEGTNLSQETKERILKELPSVQDVAAKSGNDAISSEDIPAGGEQMKQALINHNDEIDNLLRSTPDLTDAEKAKIRSVKGRIGSLYTRVADFFGPDTKGRTWARRTGKAAYFSLIGLFLIVVLEMNLINKLSRRQGGGGR